ncbi:glycosyltransferase [Pseudosulfitobacter sp. SM2401]|uniref:glycosyltransferase n=1 Tax=Pseudosulfitobacter sp. SM2401 TaxID=3350098 RepID=UPI0036F3C019
MPKHALVAIVVTMNRLDHLQKTLDRLLASDAQTLGAVVVVNNQSTDGTGAWLTAHSDARVIHLPQGENRGGAGGFEAGLCHVRDHMAADWVLLMDDDGRPAAGCLEAFHSAPREGIDGWVSAVRYPSGAICEMNRPWINPFWSVSGFIRGLTKGRAGFHIPNTAFDGGVVEIDGGSFVGLFLSARAIDLAGLPDGDLFLYGDDVLYCLRLRRNGGRVGFDPSLGFEHDCETFDADDGTIAPLWKAYYMHRNQLMMYRVAAGALFPFVVALFVPRWWFKARKYGAAAPVYRRVLARAIKDGLARRTDMTFAQVQALAVQDPFVKPPHQH